MIMGSAVVGPILLARMRLSMINKKAPFRHGKLHISEVWECDGNSAVGVGLIITVVVHNGYDARRAWCEGDSDLTRLECGLSYATAASIGS